MKEYDLIFSLGANCSAAHNLAVRGLRPFALPFDWTFFLNEKAIINLADGFKNGFKSFMQYENLVELDSSEYAKAHNDKFQYKDIATGYYYVNHFTEPLKNRSSYDIQMVKFRRRFERLCYVVSESSKICIVGASDFYISKEALEYLIKSIHDVFGNKKISIYMLNFSCERAISEETDCIKIYRYERKMNSYDFSNTNIEWSFLDDFKLLNKNTINENSITKDAHRWMEELSRQNTKDVILVLSRYRILRKYYWYKLLSKITSGKRRKRYVAKRNLWHDRVRRLRELKKNLKNLV